LAVTYQSSGVNLAAAEQSTKAIARLAKSTFNDQVVKEIGLFAGFFKLDLQKYNSPIIVSSIDGVGTKLKIAFMAGKHDSVGQCLVNHCVNDIMTCGSDPLFFLDYYGVGKLEPAVAEQVVSGMAKACRENSCALIGGETAEMPGFYTAGEYDLAGCIIGAVNREHVIDGSRIAAGDRLLGLSSTGLHTNGYSLARNVLLDIGHISLQDAAPGLKQTWAEALLSVHKSYKTAIEVVRRLPGLTGISHITGGGIVGNTIRLLRPGLALEIDWEGWSMPPLFAAIQKMGDIEAEEMRRVFNLGIGLVLVVRESDTRTIHSALKQIGETAIPIGRVVTAN
jgi:phosphoribosylformylglycinamidine cyclo-ligase